MANGLIKAMWRVLRNGRDSAGARCKPESRKKFQLESMEARILFSADIAGALELAGSSPEDSAGHPSVITASNFETPATLPAGGSDSAAIDSPSTELVFVDAGVTGYDRLLADLVSQNDGEHQVVVHVLDGERDGIEQISEVLAGYSGLDAVHIISHGSDGTIDLGGSTLDSASLQANAGLIATWGEALGAEADLLIYGCNLAATGAGQSLVTAIGNLTGADVAASDDLTGSAVLGGDWKLEYVTGNIEAGIAISEQAQQDWSGTLAVINVNTMADVIDGADSFTSLREAIIAANANADHDTIMLGAGTYDLTILNGGTSEEAAARGDLDITQDLTILGSGAGVTIIDAGAFAAAADADRVFDIISGSVIFKDVQIQNGSGDQGGGIHVKSGADLLLQDTVVSGNVGSEGGAILNDGRLDIIDSVISNNTALKGGAIENSGVLSLTRVHLVGNGSNGTIITDRGGAIYSWGTATLEDVTLSGNTADKGGGIYQEFGSLTLTNVTFSGNNALNRGGAIYSQQAAIDATNVTIAYNSAAISGGVYLSGGFADVNLKNSIIANNTATVNPNSSGPLTSLGNNIVDDLTTIAVPNTTPGQEDQLNTDPLLYPVLAFNGGLTPTHALLAGSPAINAGTTSGAPLKDQRGVMRDASPDIGAFEYYVQGSLWFSTSGTGDTGSATWSDTDIVRFTDPNLKYDPQDGTTDGSFSLLPGFSAPHDIRAMHYVGSTLTIGTTGNQTVVQEGDLLLTLDPGNSEVTAVGLTFDRHDVLLFRPTVAGDYSSGTWSMLLDEGIHDASTVYNSHAITLVEQDTRVGGTLLQAGTLIVARSTPDEHDNLYVVNVTGTGTGAATQTDDMQLLLDGDRLGFADDQIQGVELVEQSTRVGAETLAEGTLLLTLKNNSPVVVAGSLSVEPVDVFYLQVSSTELDAPGSTAATATLLFDGSDVAMEATAPPGQDERINALTLTASFFNTATPAAPVTGVANTVPGNQNIAEDVSLVFSSGTGNAITVDDGTAGDPELRTTLSVTNGTLTLATTAGITIDSGANGTADMTIHGTESAINAALDGLTFTPTGNYNGPANLQVTTDLDAHLLGNYSFDTASPGTNDSDPGTNDGIVIGDPVTVFDATRNSDVLVLDGDDSIQIPGRFGKPADVTLAAWVSMDAARTNDELISIGNSVALRLDDTNLGDGVTGFFWDGAGWRHTSTSLNISGTGWHHVAYTFDDAANEQTIYIDGVALMTTNNTASIVYNRAPDTSLGSHASGGSYFLSGMLDDARIYERALTAGEIAALASDLGSDTSVVDITVDPVNDAPVAGDLAVNALEDGPVVTGSFVATDVESTDTHTFDVTGAPAEGSVANNGNGTFSFNPGSDFQDLAEGETRDVTFTYTATDDSGAGNDASTPATATVTVTGTNDQPTAGDLAFTLTEDDGKKEYSFIVNDIDVSDSHTFIITSTLGAGSGALVNKNDGKFTFDPGGDFQDLAFGESRDVSFTYTAMDDSGMANATSTNGTVTLTVTGSNDRPVVSDVAISAIEDGATVTGSFVVDDVDDTDLHTFNITSAPAEGSVVNNGNGTFTFNPGVDFQDLAEGETRVVSFDYKATDDSGTGNAVSENGKVRVTVTGGNDRPVVSDLVFTRTEDEGSKDFSFVVNDVDDDDNHTFTITSTLPAGSGTLVNKNDGKFSFDPGSDFQDLAEGETRDVSFTYRATDNSGTANAISTDAMVTITVTGKNDRPVVSDIVINAIEDRLAVTGSFVVSDIDDSDAHTFDITSNPDEGSVLNNNDGTFSFDPGSDFQDLSAGETRVVSFEYEATDDSGGGSDTSAKARVSVTVTGSNDAPLLDNTGDMALASTGSQATNPAGTSVAAIIASAGGDRIGDADSAALEGIAVTGVDDANGEWQYNIGSGWTAFGSVSDTKAVLLDPAALVRFVADAGYFGTVDLGFRAWDQTVGSNGQTGVNVLLDNGGDAAFSQGSETATVTVVDGVLWLTTEHNVSSGGASGLDAWEKGDLLLFGSPDLSLAAPATSGSFAAAFDIDRFAPGANTNAVHHVTRDMQLGSSGFQLKAGDLLLSLDQDSNTLASTSVPTAPGFMNTLTVKDNDVFVFRPDSAGDYSAGTFAMLLENPLGADIRALTLVQQSTTVGDTVLQKGDFLMSASGDVFDKKITLWETDDVGAGSTSGIPVTLLNGTDVNVKISGHIWGIDLVEKATSTGGQTLGSGTILLSVHESTDVGKNNLSVNKSDVFALAVTKTSLVAGTGNGEATASMFFAGADVGLDSGDEHLDGLALVFVSPNNAPLATDDGSLATPLSTAEDTAVAIDVLANDTDPDGSLDPATVSIVSGPLHGALSVNAVSGMVTYSPDADYSGSDAFSYTVRDDSGDTSNLAQVTLEVTAVNDAPVVTPVDLGNSDEDAGRLITQAELLAGASDVDNLSADLTAVNLAVTGGSGTLIDHADGSWTFTPALNWNGAVTFSFAVSDGAASTPNTASLAVDALNDAPQVDPVVTDTGTQDTDQTYSHDELLALVNAYDVDDADTGLIIGISNVVNGSLVLSGGTGGADTTFTFTPDPGFNGILGFDYQVADAAGALSATGNASLNIIASNNPPQASDDGSAALPLGTAEDTPLDIDVLANDSDPDGSLDPATVNIGSGPAHGSVSTSPLTGVVTYTPAANYAGVDSFSYTVRDNDGAVSKLARVYLEISPVNDAPVATDDGSLATPVSTAEDTALAIDVLANDSDLDGSLDPATVNILSGPDHGALALNTVTGVLVYTPDADYNGSDAFSYTVRDDGGAASNLARVVLEVTAVNDAPVVVPVDLGSIDEDTSRLITQADLLAGVSDVDNTAAELTAGNLAVTGGSGTLIDHGDGTWTLKLTDNWNGTVTFSFAVSDGTDSTPNTASLRVDPLADAPDIDGVDSGDLTEDDDADFDGLLETAAALTISDPDSGESAFVAGTVTGAYGELTIDAAGNWIYAADNSQAAIQSLAVGATLTDTLTVTSTDGTGHDVDITITGVNDAPTLASPLQDQDVSENAAFLFTFALNAFDDIDGDTLVYSVTQGDGSALPAWLSFDAAGRTLSGTPTPADVGMIVLKVTADDGKGGVVSDEFTLTVKEVNTLPIVVISPPDPGTGEPSPPVDSGTPDPSTGDPGEEQTTQPPRAAGGDPVENGPSAEPEGSVEEAPAESGSETSADKEVVEEAPAEDEAAAQEADTAPEQAGSADSSADSNGIGLRSGQGKLLQIGGFVKELNEQRELIHERDYFQHTVVGSTMTVTTGLSVGYVVWLIRGGVLLSSLLSSLPAWRWVDPLPVLASLARDSEDDEDDESLETIVEGSEEEPESETDPDDDKTAVPEKTVKDDDE